LQKIPGAGTPFIRNIPDRKAAMTAKNSKKQKKTPAVLLRRMVHLRKNQKNSSALIINLQEGKWVGVRMTARALRGNVCCFLPE
jgi:hypothetical protein